MANNGLKLDIPNVEATEPKPVEKKGKNTKKSAKNKTKTNRRSFGKFCRDIISELKKVSWAKFKDTNGNNGVLSNLVTVLIVVFVFIIVISAFDLGLTKIFQLLLNAEL